MVVGYAVFERARGIPKVAPVLRPVQVLGTKGLPGYVAMVLAVLVIDYLGAVPRTDATLLVVVAVCGAAEFAAVRFATRRRHVPASPAASVADATTHPALT